MQAQKLDTKKDFGTVFNHDRIAYVQDGNYYDAGGELVEQDLAKIVSKREKEVKESKKAAEKPSSIVDFILDSLEKGPVSQASIKREAEKLGFDWQKVIKESTELPITKYKKGVIFSWKLSEEE